MSDTYSLVCIAYRARDKDLTKTWEMCSAPIGSSG